MSAQRVDPRQAEQRAREANSEARQATQNLNRDINNDIGKLQRSTRTMNKLENELEAAKRSADRAVEAAFTASQVAHACDEADFKRLAKQARDALENFKRQKERAENTELDLQKEINDAMNDAKKRTTDIQNTIDAGVKAANDAGLPVTSVTFGNLANAQQMLNNELAELNSEGTKAKDFKDEGSLHKLNKAKSELDTKLKKIKEDNAPKDVSDPEEYVDQRLREAEAWMKENCPKKKVASAPRTAPDFYAAVDNRPEQIACVDRVMTDQEANDMFGELGGGQILTAKDSGTLFKTVANTQTIERVLASRGLKQCFAPEPNYCTIMTPLTGFRGHDHKHHHGHPHEHDAPDPPLNWGITPPETVIRLEARR